MRLITDFFFLIVFFVLLVGWILAWGLMHVASAGIHVLLGLAVVCLIIHFFRGRSAA
jgi:hypothetical protein